jgi:hypothetical protein
MPLISETCLHGMELLQMQPFRTRQARLRIALLTD